MGASRNGRFTEVGAGCYAHQDENPCADHIVRPTSERACKVPYRKRDHGRKPTLAISRFSVSRPREEQLNYGWTMVALLRQFVNPNRLTQDVGGFFANKRSLLATSTASEGSKSNPQLAVLILPL